MRTIAAAVAALFLATGPHPHATAAGAQLTRAIHEEQLALAALRRHPPQWAGAAAHLTAAKAALHTVQTELAAARTANEITNDDRLNVLRDSGLAQGLDDDAKDEADAHRAITAISHIRDALALKQRAQTKLAGALLSTACASTKKFPVYAPGQGSTGVWNDVFVHNVPAAAQNIRVTFVDLATGQAPTQSSFGANLHWTVEPGEFTTKDGVPVYRVRVNVLGAGSGAADANVRQWEVHVVWGC